MLTERNATTRVKWSEVDSRRRLVATAASILVIVVLAVAGIGVAALNQTQAVDSIQFESNVIGDLAPFGEPNYDLLEEYLNGAEATVEADYGVFVGATWEPNYGLLEEYLNGAEATSEADYGVFVGPTWEPNYALLESLLNPRQPSGPR